MEDQENILAYLQQTISNLQYVEEEKRNVNTIDIRTNTINILKENRTMLGEIQLQHLEKYDCVT